MQVLRKPQGDVRDSLRQIRGHRTVAGFADGLPHRLDGIFAGQHVQRKRRESGNRRAWPVVRGLQGVLEHLPTVLQTGADDQDRTSVLAFVEGREIPPPVAVDVLHLVNGEQQRAAVPPAEVFGFAQQLVQRQVRPHAQFESGAPLHRSSDPSEGATDLPLRPLNVLRHRRRNVVEHGGREIARTFAEFLGDQRQMRDFRCVAKPFAGHGLAGELPQKPRLANALDAVDQHQAVFRILLVHDVFETRMERRQFLSPAGEVQRTRPISAKQRHAVHYCRINCCRFADRRRTVGRPIMATVAHGGRALVRDGADARLFRAGPSRAWPSRAARELGRHRLPHS